MKSHHVILYLGHASLSKWKLNILLLPKNGKNHLKCGVGKFMNGSSSLALPEDKVHELEVDQKRTVHTIQNGQ